MSQLAKDLMGAREEIKKSIECDVTFTSKDKKGITLLLLDISGSMNGQPLEDLKQAVHSLEESYNVEWIAFDDDVVASSFDEGANIDTLCSGGGTNFIPPLMFAVEKMKKELYNNVILISDGCPFEPVEKILAVALQLQQPLNTISIGNGGAEVMKDLSEKTGGTQVVVNEVKELIHWEGKMQTIVKMGEVGDLTFGQLLAKCHIPGCAKALRDFVRSRMPKEAVTLNSLIAGFPGAGLAEWAQTTKRGSALSHTATILEEQYILGVNEVATHDESFMKVVEQELLSPCPVVVGDPFILATLMCYRGLNLTDFAWVGIDETCSDLNDREQLQMVLQDGMKITNLYDRPIR